MCLSLDVGRQVCESLELHGLVLVGGDGSNSNAALLAEYFQKHLPHCAVVGVPKTIDGDLKSPLIEASFGFDTAAKTYSELIGNLCVDVTSSQVNPRNKRKQPSLLPVSVEVSPSLLLLFFFFLCAALLSLSRVLVSFSLFPCSVNSLLCLFLLVLLSVILSSSSLFARTPLFCRL